MEIDWITWSVFGIGHAALLVRSKQFGNLVTDGLCQFVRSLREPRLLSPAKSALSFRGFRLRSLHLS